ncbi:hypothetical protein fragment 1 [Helicobacter acinonychis str. Sheeba]|uniref:Uncharacterized protein n=1 Tax=Helicobacter acinonychis (strain Sheeba) TaxID=382638 RepID=Q17XD7_HELAH|nr:hypothetical protein fragment 1 [Helicobacter acinonychis str. Sheeba]
MHKIEQLLQTLVLMGWSLKKLGNYSKEMRV